MLIIILNSILIGVQTSYYSEIVNFIQEVILGIFLAEIVVRWLGKVSIKAYLTNAWNWFDVILVAIALIPEDLFSNSSAIVALRVMRVFRVLRVFKAFPELQLMVKVLLKSVQSVMYGGLLLFIFMYIYSIIGVILFKGDSTVVTAHSSSLDPFGGVSEAFFSLFRVATGEDWTDLRYDLLVQETKISYMVVNLYFVSWYILAAFLLLNIVFGAIINNYHLIYNMDSSKQAGEKINEKLLFEKIEILKSKLELLSQNKPNHNSKLK